MFDPMFVTIGANSLLGEATLLIPHVIEGTTLAHYSIAIGNDVTIGARALLLAGVTVGDGAIVAANAVVLKGERIGAGEVWGGIPARLLGQVRNGGGVQGAAAATLPGEAPAVPAMY
jgi:acetyltransferase-like isoleucine patch superfamily enzyme